MATTITQPPRPPAQRPPAPAAPRRRTEIRPEIQALRALAVSTVVAWHYWPHSLTGGFIGVDVFFAISGFLITSHLLREVDKRGKVGLAQFWARRARRILPAAFLVLFVVAVATIVFVPELYWSQYLSETRASTAYVQNWYLAGEAVNYFAADNLPVARPALLVAVGRGAVLPHLAGADPDRRRAVRAVGRAAAPDDLLRPGGGHDRELHLLDLLHPRRPPAGVLHHPDPGLGVRPRRAAGARRGAEAAAAGGA